MSGVRHRVIGGNVHAIPDGVCGYCYAHDRPRAAPPFHCAECDRHIGATRSHVLTPYPPEPSSRVLCGRCADRLSLGIRGVLGPRCSRAAAAVVLGVWP